MTKLCYTCREEKPFCDFYKHGPSKDGLNPSCKTCVNRKIKRRIGTKRLCLQCGKEFESYSPVANACSPKCNYHLNLKERLRRSHKSKPDKELRLKAREILNNAVQQGKLIRPNRCDVCGAATFPDAHHIDYSEPLKVAWLCKPCHKEQYHGST